MSSKRLLKKPKDSFFLFGPRGTGKSTWIQNDCKPDLIIDLLKAKNYNQYLSNPSLLSEIISGNSNYKTIAIDEIQKLPILLDEVHSLIFESKNKIQFILTGSSSRKLKQKNVNLLAGRALVRSMHPFSSLELKNSFNLQSALAYGMLPAIWNLSTNDEKIDYLHSYVETYLKEEILQEALVRSLPSYTSFLTHFAARNGQVINLLNLSREIGISRSTLVSYMEILEQTLLGYKLLPIELKAKVKEVSLPKFYFFDTGVVRTLNRKIDEKISDDEKGTLLETYFLHELKTYSDSFNKRLEFFYWGTPSKSEVDFIVTKGSTAIGIEVKSSTNWNKKFNRGLETLIGEKKIKTAFGVYLGHEILKQGSVKIYPIEKFLNLLYEDELI